MRLTMVILYLTKHISSVTSVVLISFVNNAFYDPAQYSVSFVDYIPPQ
jgi:hypothetical protein